MALSGEASMESCVHGFHVYQDVWLPVMGETLLCHRETDNLEDRHAVAYYKSEEVVGHVPRKISRLCSAFLRRGGAIRGTVTGSRRYSSDLEQGGMEIPCKMIFKGPLTELQKVKRFFLSAFRVEVIVSGLMIDDASASSSVTTTVSDSTDYASASSSVTTNVSVSTPSEKRTVDAKNSECSQAKRVKCVDSASVSNLAVASSLTASTKLLPPAENRTKGDVAEKFVKCITISDSESSSTVQSIVNSTEVWVRFQRSSLTMEDKGKIENGSRLTDKHIGFANLLISRQFPHIGGLRSTLLQNRYYCFPSQSIQPIFCKEREHWIVASNVMQDHKTVNVYDSLFTELDRRTYDLILQIFHARNNDQRATVVMKELQKQKGSADCGLFAIAVMTSLAHKEDPSTVKYDQNKMRQHLVDSFSSKFLMPFPKL